jgi:hypothetical protein
MLHEAERLFSHRARGALRRGRQHGDLPRRRQRLPRPAVPADAGGARQARGAGRAARADAAERRSSTTGATWPPAMSTWSSATGCSRPANCTWAAWSATRWSAWWPRTTRPSAAAGRCRSTCSASMSRRCRCSPGALGVIDEHLSAAGVQREIVVRASHFSLIPLMVADSLLVLTTGRLFCSRYVDTLPVRIVRCPVAFPPLNYYQLWHDLTHNASSMRWFREQVREVARQLAGRRCRCARRRHDRDPRRPARLHRHAGLGRHGRCSGVRWRPDHWLLVRRRPHRRRAARGAGTPGPELAARRPPRPADPARLHRHPRAQPAARRDRQLRHRAARLAGALHLPVRATPCRPGRGRSRCERFLDALLAHGTTRRWCSRRCTRSRPRRCSAAQPARHAAGLPARC